MSFSKHIPLPNSKSNFFHEFNKEKKTPASKDEKLNIKLVLNTSPEIEENIHHRLSLEERKSLFIKIHGATEPELDLIRKFANIHDLEITKINKEIGIIHMAGTIEAIENAFKVQLHNHEYIHPIKGQKLQVIGHMGNAHLPEELHPFVSSIIGLNNVPLHHNNLISKNSTTEYKHEDATGYPSSWFADHYNFPKNHNGKGQKIAIISCGGGFSNDDFNNYFDKIGINPPPKINWVSVDHINIDNSPPGNNINKFLSDYENATDCLVSAGAAIDAEITVYFTKNDIKGFSDAVEAIIEEGEVGPSIISYSWGGSERNNSLDDILGINKILRYATLVNKISIFCATGDKGSTNDAISESNAPLAIQYPASSPWVTACGGTMFDMDSKGADKEEVAWNSNFLYPPNPINVTGGGFSDFISCPDFQKEVVKKNYSNEYKGKRGIPDISGYANVSDDNVGYWISANGSDWISGGTSAVAPLLAALIARINESLGERIGFVNSWLYKMVDTPAIIEVTNGNNAMPNGPNKWDAGPTWNPCTGLGVVNGNEMLKWLKANVSE